MTIITDEQYMKMDYSDKQQVFDFVVAHARQQNKQSSSGQPSSGQICLYRGPNNTACFIGCLIPEQHYTKKIEGEAFENIRELFCDTKLYLMDIMFAIELQYIHDAYFPAWETKLMELAQKYNLIWRAKQ